jgi:hypothetical protein
MNGKHYIPRNDRAFLAWAKVFIHYLASATARFGLLPIGTSYADMISDFETALEACADPNHGKLDITRKNLTRQTLEKACRELVQGYLARNPRVTREDREAMGIAVYDATPTPIPVPMGLPAADVSYPGGQLVQLLIRHIEGTPLDPKAEHGTKVAYDLFHVDEPIPARADQLHRSVFTRRKKHVFTFDQADSGKRACFCLRYENGKGDAGPWGQMITAVIP